MLADKIKKTCKMSNTNEFCLCIYKRVRFTEILLPLLHHEHPNERLNISYFVEALNKMNSKAESCRPHSPPPVRRVAQSVLLVK